MMKNYIEKEIYKFKKDGKLIAISHMWEYWLVDETLYAVRTDGTNYCFWCSVERLNRHLHRLYQITGKKMFTEDKDIFIVNNKFLSQFAYA